MRGAEDCLFPCAGGEEDVVFDFLLVFFFEFTAEDEIREADSVADAGGKGDVCIVEVSGPPRKRPGIECDKQCGITISFGAPEQRDGDFVILRPIKLEPSHAITARFGDFFDAAAGGCAEDVGDADFGGDFRDAEFFVLVEDGLDADGGDEEGGFEFVAEEGCS